MEFKHDLDAPKPFFINNSLDNIILYKDISYIQLFYFYFSQFIIYDVTKITIYANYYTYQFYPRFYRFAQCIFIIYLKTQII